MEEPPHWIEELMMILLLIWALGLNGDMMALTIHCVISILFDAGCNLNESM